MRFMEDKAQRLPLKRFERTPSRKQFSLAMVHQEPAHFLVSPDNFINLVFGSHRTIENR